MQSFLGVLLHCTGETHDLSNFRTICKNSCGLVDAVPTRNPPTFPDSNISSQLFEDTEPPYKYFMKLRVIPWEENHLSIPLNTSSIVVADATCPVPDENKCRYS